MTDLEQTQEKELIIIRRRHDINIEKPHSGVWKIAHADFMTAMMAFFMVMWLISSTDDAAKKHIARYFNPVKLSAMTSFPKGLEDPDPKDMKVGPEATPPKASSPQDDADDGRALSLSEAPAEANGPSRQASAARSRGKEDSRPLPTFTEAEIFSDPYGVLDRIVMKEKSPQASLRTIPTPRRALPRMIARSKAPAAKPCAIHLPLFPGVSIPSRSTKWI